MKFANPDLLYLLALPLALILFYMWIFKQRRKVLERFIQKKLVSALTTSFDLGKWKIKVFLVIVIFTLCVFSLIRPKWGFHWEEVKRKGLDILVALDTSKSMLAEDVRPNRLKRSKLAIQDMVRKLKGDRIGLIAFSGTAFLQCPLTVDYNGFMLSLDSVKVGIIPKGGTSISSAIKDAIKVYKDAQAKYKILIIITDGEDHEGYPVKMAEFAKKEDITIYCIGIGTQEGDLIPFADNSGRKGFLKDRQGNVVKTRLDETTLQKIALTTGGSYVRSTSRDFGLDFIYDEKLSKFEKRELSGKMVKYYEERFQIPLGIAFLLLLVEPFITDRRRERWLR